MHTNVKLLLAVVLKGVLAYAAVSSNFSLSKFISERMNGYASPYGPRPSKFFVDRWEAERSR